MPHAPTPPLSDDEAMQADAARFRLLQRVLPFQRHEVAGHLSTSRLALMTAKRRMANGNVAGAADLLQDMEGQVAGAIEQLRRLRWWDAPTGASEPLQLVVQTCLPALEALAVLRGQRVAAQAQDDADAACSCAVPQAYFAVLAAGLHAIDEARTGDAWQLRLHPQGVQAERAPRDDAPEVLAPPLEGPAGPLPLWAAQVLAADAGASFQPLHDGWHLAWP